MTNPTTSDLIERLEKAEGGSRELDCEIGVAIGRFFTVPSKGWPDRLDYCERRGDDTAQPGHGFDQLVPRYTTSLDSAMSLVPEGCARRIEYHPDLKLAYAEVFNADDGESAGKGRARTEPLALAAAALRARETTNGG